MDAFSNVFVIFSARENDLWLISVGTGTMRKDIF